MLSIFICTLVFLATVLLPDGAEAFTSVTRSPNGRRVAHCHSANRQKSNERFDHMVSELLLPATTMEFIDSPRQRLLFRGLQAAAADAEIRDAFQIVYEDIAPIRAAGELIFSGLQRVAAEASRRAAEAGDLRALVHLAASRNLFRLVDGDSSGSLDRREILQSPELLALVREGGEGDGDAVDRFMAAHDQDRDGVLSFVEFARAVEAEPRLREGLTAAIRDDDDDGGDGSTSSSSALMSKALADSRRLFDRLDGDGDGSIDREELLASPALLALIRRRTGGEQAAGRESGGAGEEAEAEEEEEDDEAVADRFLAGADRDADGTISFVEFAVAACEEPALQCVNDALLRVDEALAQSQARATDEFLLSSPAGALLSSRQRRRGSSPIRGGQVGAAAPPPSAVPSGPLSRIPGRRLKPDDRFNAMLAECLTWDQPLRTQQQRQQRQQQQQQQDEEDEEEDDEEEDDEEEEGHGDGAGGSSTRLVQVILGALAGARNPSVTEALRACYLDYPALRVGGDIIFRLMRRTVAAQTKERKSKKGIF